MKRDSKTIELVDTITSRVNSLKAKLHAIRAMVEMGDIPKVEVCTMAFDGIDDLEAISEVLEQ